jgi:integrase
MSTLYKRNKTYYVQFYKDGKQERKSLGTTALSVARQIQKQIEKDLALGKYNVEDERQDCPIEDFRERYFAWAEEHKRPKTVLTERNFFDQFVEFTGIKTLGEAKRDDVERFKISCKRKGWKAGSVNSALSTLRAIYSYAIQWELVEHNPVKGVKHFKREKNPPKYLTREEAERVLSIAEEHSQDIHWVFALGIYAGLRKNEIANARWEWFDFRHKLVTLSSHGRFTLKDSETRTVPLHSKLASILEPHSHKEGYLFVPEKQHDAKYGYRYDFKKEFEEVCRKADVSWVTPHVLRHTFASQLAMAGVSLYKIGKWLGHSDFKTTQIYAHLQASDDDIEKL